MVYYLIYCFVIFSYLILYLILYCSTIYCIFWHLHDVFFFLNFQHVIFSIRNVPGVSENSAGLFIRVISVSSPGVRSSIWRWWHLSVLELWVLSEQGDGDGLQAGMLQTNFGAWAWPRCCQLVMGIALDSSLDGGKSKSWTRTGGSRMTSRKPPKWEKPGMALFLGWYSRGGLKETRSKVAK